MQISRKYLLTGAAVLIAVVAVLLKYGSYVVNPWTRDGQVRADVIQVTPRVSGPIVRLPIRDNQQVKAGDLLFEIDPRTYQASLDQASAQLEQTGDSVLALQKQVEAARAAVDGARANIDGAKSRISQLDSIINRNKSEYERQQELLKQNATSQRYIEAAQASYEASLRERDGAQAALVQSQASLLQAQAGQAEAEAKLGAVGEANASVRSALAAVRQAQLNLEFTQVRAPVDAYVTNLNLRVGGQAVTNQPALALVDVKSFWVNGYFKETSIAQIHAGDKALVTLMGYPDDTLEGTVDSIGCGVSHSRMARTGFELLPNVDPTFGSVLRSAYP